MEVRLEFVLFDLGGVLCDVRPARAQSAWENLYPAGGSIVDAMARSGSKPQGDVGALDPQGMADVLSAYLQQQVSEKELRKVWGSMVSWRPFVPSLIDLLRLPYGVLSTIDPIHSDALGLLAGADPVVYSWKIGVTKPFKKAFELALARCPVPPEQVLYVDDLTENVEQARRCGMVAHQVTCEDEILAVLGPYVA